MNWDNNSFLQSEGRKFIFQFSVFSIIRVYNRRIYINPVLDSSMVEHTAVNRGVVGSSPTRGV